MKFGLFTLLECPPFKNWTLAMIEKSGRSWKPNDLGPRSPGLPSIAG